MSFQNKNFIMERDSQRLTDGEIRDASSRVDHKCAYPWYVGSSDPQLSCNKKQAIDSLNCRPPTSLGTVDANISLWDRISNPEPGTAFNHSDKKLSSVGSSNLNLQSKGVENHYNVSGSSMDNPRRLNSAYSKSKINQVTNSEHCFSVGHPYGTDENGTITMSSTYQRTGTSISLGQSYFSENGIDISMGPSFNKTSENLISVGQNFSKGDGSFMLMGHQYHRGDNRMLLMGQQFEKGNCNLLSMDHQLYEKDNGNLMSSGGSAYSQDQSFTLADPSYDAADQSFLSAGGAAYDYEKDRANIMNSLVLNQGKENVTIVSMDQNYDKGGSAVLPLGVFHDEHVGSDPTGRLISHYDLLISQSSVQATNESLQEKSAEQNANQIKIPMTAPTATTKMDGVPKNKDKKISKKDESNSFPANVKSLLSTGIFNGVPVMYVSWSRDKKLQGVIKGSGYLCGCSDCNLSKALNAYEFEHHAGCKTKHPNNHIYFENGKTVYAVVQELKSTPQEKLFETIQDVCGSPINEKNFRSWKASYQAATLELQRIYGRSEVALPS